MLYLDTIEGISQELLAPLFGARGGTTLAERLLRIVNAACLPTTKVRLVTLALSLRILHRVAPWMTSNQKKSLNLAREQSTATLRNFYKSEEIFLDMFEHEYFDMSKGPLNVEWLCMDSAILLPPTGTPMTGIEFTKRLPCGEVERARRAIRIFFLIRDLAMTLNEEPETQLPLTNPQQCVQVNNVLDLNNSDLIGCTVLLKDGTKMRRFLVIDIFQLILVEPDSTKLGWGVAKLVGFLQDIEVLGDKDDSRCLHITIQKPLSSSSSNRIPLLSAKFVFDDHIRCMAAKQRLTKGRIKARQKKMQQIAKLLDIPGPTSTTVPLLNSASGLLGGGGQTISNFSVSGLNALSSKTSLVSGATRSLIRGDNRPGVVTARPGFATPRRDSLPGSVHRMIPTNDRSSKPSSAGGRSRDSSSSRIRSREGSPRMPRPRSEEIPLELMKKTGSGNISTCQSENSGSSQSTPRYTLDTVGESPVMATTGDHAVAHQLSANSSVESEETSFIAQDATRSLSSHSAATRRKGVIETV